LWSERLRKSFHTPVNVVEVPVLGVVGADGDDLVVGLALVDHGHESDGLGPEEASGDDWLLHDDEYVDGVAVVAERARDESVVVRVDDRGVEHAVDLDEPRLLVQLVLDLAALGDLDHLHKDAEWPLLEHMLIGWRKGRGRWWGAAYAVEDGGGVGADLEVVPGVGGDGAAGDGGEDPLVEGGSLLGRILVGRSGFERGCHLQSKLSRRRIDLRSMGFSRESLG
jgi:hypothetical protein